MFGVGKLAVRQVKLPFQPAVVMNPEPEPELCSFSLLFLRDILSDREFLVDSGASVSLFLDPRSDFSCGAGSKVYTWTFQLAPVSVPLLGADFLEHFDLLVDINGQKVVHAQYLESVVLHASLTPQPAFCPASYLSAPPQIQKLFSKFPDVLSSNGFNGLETSPWCPSSSSYCSSLF